MTCELLSQKAADMQIGASFQARLRELTLSAEVQDLMVSSGEGRLEAAAGGVSRWGTCPWR